MSKITNKTTTYESLFFSTDVDVSLDQICTEFGRTNFLKAAFLAFEGVNADDLSEDDKAHVLGSMVACYDHAQNDELANNFLGLVAANFKDENCHQELASRLRADGKLIEAADWSFKLAVYDHDEAEQNLNELFHRFCMRFDQFAGLPESLNHDRVLIEGHNQETHLQAFEDIRRFLDEGEIPSRIQTCQAKLACN